MKAVLEELLAKVLPDYDFKLSKTNDIKFGHYSSPIAFSLAKILRKSPQQIAQDLTIKLQEESYFKNVTAVAGYINFRLSSTFLQEQINQVLKEGFTSNIKKSKSIFIEYISANPTGPLHIGHARGAIYGNTLARIGQFLGHRVFTEYYVNDAGNQIDLLTKSVIMKAANLNEQTLHNQDFDNTYKGEYIDEIAAEIKTRFSKQSLSLENTHQFKTFCKDKALAGIKNTLKTCNISFDSFVSENIIAQQWTKIFSFLDQKGFIYSNNKGQKLLRTTRFGDEKDRVIIREDGTTTYISNDIAYHDFKFQQGFDHYINIWGADHHGYIARVKASLEMLNHNSDKLEVILIQMVSLLKNGQPYKMSKRAGNFITIDEVIEKIGVDNLRFTMLTAKFNSHLNFDLQTIYNTDKSNAIYYINYAHARVHSILYKLNLDINTVLNYELQELHQDEADLIFQCLLMPEFLQSSFDSRNLQNIVSYLYDLAANFHQFYAKTKILNNSRQDHLLKIISFIAFTISETLKILSIQAQSKM